MRTTKSKTNFTAIVAAIIIGLLGINAFLLYNNKMHHEKENARLTQEVDDSAKLKLELEKQYYEALSELESMKTGNEELNALIDQQKQELQEKKNKISRLIGQGRKSKTELAEVQEMMSGLRSQLDGYVTEVTQLKQEKELLEQQNVKLAQDKKVLETDLSSQRTMNTELVTAKAALVSEKESLESEKAKLNEKVTQASVVKVMDVTATSWKVKKSGKPAKTRSADKTDRIKVCFTTTQNEVTVPGTEKFYVRLINPIGETLAVENLGSGIMTSGASNEEIRYTQIKELDYANDAMVGCFLWEPNTTFSDGKYTVEVYNKGYLAGTGSLLLK